MNETTVYQLPDEVLVEVFKLLDTRSLKNTVLTCREWNEVVEQSIPWTLMLDYMYGDAQEQMELVLASNRKYDKAIISGDPRTQVTSMPLLQMEFDDNGKLQTFERHGGRIRELKLIGWKVDNALLFCQLLYTMPNLESVFLQKFVTSQSTKDLSTDLLPALQNLKSLEVLDSSCNMLKIFEQCQIQKLKIFNDSGDSHQQLLAFLATQLCLDELVLRRNDSSKVSLLFKTPIPEEFISFRLKKLSLLGINFSRTPNGNDNLMEFVKLHVQSLETLEIDRNLPESFYEFAFEQLKHLKTLKFDLDGLFSPNSWFFERLAVNRNVTSLQVLDRNEASVIKGFLNRLPNVENLTLDYFDCTNGLAEYIADNLKKLKKFSVERIDGREFIRLRFHALKTLQITHLEGFVSWDVFTKNNRGIIDLWIGSLWNQNAIDIQAITQNLQLRQLTIESSTLSCDEKFFDIIRKNCASLELQLNAKSLKVDISTVADIPNLRFRDFPFSN